MTNSSSVSNINNGKFITPEQQAYIHEQNQAKLNESQQLEYESLDGYELPPRTQFPMLNKPAVTIKYGKFSFNMACIRLFSEFHDIVPISNKSKKRLAVIPCKEDESASVQWSRIDRNGKLVNKNINSIEFIEKIYDMMNWNRECKYKIIGRLAQSPKGIIIIFDLEDAVMFEAQPEEYVNKETGEVKKRYVAYYPEYCSGHVGRSYNDYVATQQNLFEQFEGYTPPGQTYSNNTPPISPPITPHSGGSTGGIAAGGNGYVR